MPEYLQPVVENGTIISWTYTSVPEGYIPIDFIINLTIFIGSVCLILVGLRTLWMKWNNQRGKI